MGSVKGAENLALKTLLPTKFEGWPSRIWYFKRLVKIVIEDTCKVIQKLLEWKIPNHHKYAVVDSRAKLLERENYFKCLRINYIALGWFPVRAFEVFKLKLERWNPFCRSPRLLHKSSILIGNLFKSSFKESIPFISSREVARRVNPF